MDKLKVTVITPAYNRSHTLPRVYESLKNQTFKYFKWIIMDDGSTDDTEEVVSMFLAENVFEIEYRKNENAKKFYTVFKAVETVKTDYFTILDSDDAYLCDALEILVNEADMLDRTEFISVIGHSEDENGKIFGTLFPNNGFDGSILEMRYKYNVKGDKNGLFITAPYQEYLKNFNYESYKNKYAPQKIFFNIYDGNGMKTRFINQIIRVYFYDISDQGSMSNERVKCSSYPGLKDGHLSFLNSYAGQLWGYPVALLRNIAGYVFYSVLLNEGFIKSVSRIKPGFIKLGASFLYPLVYLYARIKN